MFDLDLYKEYKILEDDRDPFLDRGRVSSYYTINYLILPEGSDSNTDLTDLYQSVGSYGVNNLANKLLLTLLPPSKLFFNVELKSEVKLSLPENERIELEKLLKNLENNILTEINSSSIRNTIFNAITNLIVSGNSLLYIDENNKMRNFSIEEYVIERDSFGNILKIITKELISFEALDEDIKDLIIENEVETSTDSDKKDIKEYDLFTTAYLKNGEFVSYQQIGKMIIEDTRITYKKDELPFIALRWSAVRNENYGRSHCDLVIGDLKTLEEGSKTIVESAAIMSSIKFLVDPASGINIKKLNSSPNGAFVSGKANLIAPLQVNKSYDLQILRETILDIERRVSKHFLLADGAQRDAERVTAEEIRMLANELENTLGGVYSTLAEELQLPLVKLFIKTLEKNSKIPKTPVKFTDIKIKTGIEALGRNSEVVALNTFLQQISVFGEAAISQIDVKEYIRRIGDNLGIDMNILIKSDDRLQEEQAAAQEQKLIEDSAPGAINELTKGVVQKELQQNEQKIKG